MTYDRINRNDRRRDARCIRSTPRRNPAIRTAPDATPDAAAPPITLAIAPRDLEPHMKGITDMTPEPTQNTINSAMRTINRALDNEGVEDEFDEIADDDPNCPAPADSDITDEQLEALEEFKDRIFAEAMLKVAYERSSVIADLLLNIRDYLEVHNSRECLEGYMNDLAEEINPILAKLDMTPITIVDARD